MNKLVRERELKPGMLVKRGWRKHLLIRKIATTKNYRGHTVETWEMLMASDIEGYPWFGQYGICPVADFSDWEIVEKKP